MTRDKLGSDVQNKYLDSYYYLSYPSVDHIVLLYIKWI